MTKLRIDLREGFSGDAVEISVDGRAAYSKANVRTDYSVGVADFVELDAAGTTAQVEVRVPARGLVERATISLRAPMQHVAVVLGDRIEIKALEAPPEYF